MYASIPTGQPSQSVPNEVFLFMSRPCWMLVEPLHGSSELPSFNMHTIT